MEVEKGVDMARLIPGQILSVIDVGTSKICVLVARILQDGRLAIISVGTSVSDGLKKGVVVDIDQAVNSITNAVKEAQEGAGFPINEVVIGIAGSHIHSMNSHGVGPITKGCITSADVKQVLASAKAIPLGEGEQILHVLPQHYVIDGHEKSYNPIGMHGIRLEADVHIIVGRITSVQNLVNCCHKAGLRVVDIVLEQLASADAVLTKDERHLGVALLDIGGGTTDLVIYKQGSIYHTMTLPVAGDHFTHDIAVGLRTTHQEAERIKKESAIAFSELLYDNEQIEIVLADEQHKTLVSLAEINHIVEPRARELLTLMHQEMVSKHLLSVAGAGLVITGGGSQLSGIKEVAESIFAIPVRIGRPHADYTLPELLDNPVYATGYGLLLRTIKKQLHHESDYNDLILKHSILSRVKTWVTHLF